MAVAGGVREHRGVREKDRTLARRRRLAGMNSETNSLRPPGGGGWISLRKGANETNNFYRQQAPCR